MDNTELSPTRMTEEREHQTSSTGLSDLEMFVGGVLLDGHLNPAPIIDLSTD